MSFACVNSTFGKVVLQQEITPASSLKNSFKCLFSYIHNCSGRKCHFTQLEECSKSVRWSPGSRWTPVQKLMFPLALPVVWNLLAYFGGETHFTFKTSPEVYWMQWFHRKNCFLLLKFCLVFPSLHQLVKSHFHEYWKAYLAGYPSTFNFKKSNIASGSHM